MSERNENIKSSPLRNTLENPHRERDQLREATIGMLGGLKTEIIVEGEDNQGQEDLQKIKEYTEYFSPKGAAFLQRFNPDSHALKLQYPPYHSWGGEFQKNGLKYELSIVQSQISITHKIGMDQVYIGEIFVGPEGFDEALELLFAEFVRLQSVLELERNEDDKAWKRRIKEIDPTAFSSDDIKEIEERQKSAPAQPGRVNIGIPKERQPYALEKIKFDKLVSAILNYAQAVDITPKKEDLNAKIFSFPSSNPRFFLTLEALKKGNGYEDLTAIIYGPDPVTQKLVTMANAGLSFDNPGDPLEFFITKLKQFLEKNK